MRPSQVPLEHIFAFDFETTGEANLQADGAVRVWLWSLVNCATMECWYGYDIDSFIRMIGKLHAKLCFAHNLRFDGSFLMWYCLKHNITTEQIIDGHSKQWFSFRAFGCEFRDSMKKFPMSLQSLAYELGIPGKEEKPDFGRYIPPGYRATPEEIEYCVQDSRIVAHAVVHEFNAGRMRLTASSEAYAKLQRTVPNFKKYFPSLSMYEDSRVRPSYGGGICMCMDEYAGQDLEGVYVYDINSSYPAQMRNRPMPYGYGYFEEPKRDQLFVVNFTSEFSVKKNHIPSLLSARILRYAVRSDNFITESDGPTNLTMTSVDYDLFHKQYDVDYEIDHEFVSYESATGICADFIDAEMEIKAHAPKHSYPRQAAKLNMNMSYGSFGINPNAWKVTPVLQDDTIAYDVRPEQRIARYSVFASFVTAWGRHQLVTAAQHNYDRFVYSDTDSIHLTKPARTGDGMIIHDTDLGAWKPECWDGYDCYPHAKYLRPKAYCHADEDHNIFKKRLDDGRWDIELKCAGVPDQAKLGLTWDDFKLGHVVEGKLQQALVPGGVCLRPTTYTI